MKLVQIWICEQIKCGHIFVSWVTHDLYLLAPEEPFCYSLSFARVPGGFSDYYQSLSVKYHKTGEPLRPKSMDTVLMFFYYLSDYTRTTLYKTEHHEKLRLVATCPVVTTTARRFHEEYRNYLELSALLVLFEHSRLLEFLLFFNGNYYKDIVNTDFLSYYEILLVCSLRPNWDRCSL